MVGARKQPKKRKKTEAPALDPDDAPQDENQKEWLNDPIPF
jgi:hypothetical protein